MPSNGLIEASAKKRLGTRDYRNAVRTNIETLIRTGTTTVGEICTHGMSPVLLKQSGLRALVFHEIINMGSGVRGQGSGIQLPRGTGSALIKYGLSPHTPYTVSEPLLRAINVFSKKTGIRLSMHVAESKDELALLQRRASSLERLYGLAQWDLDWAPSGISSFDYLNKIGLLSPRLLVVHAVHTTDRDIALIKRSNVSIAHCPRSNKELGVGRMPLHKMLDAGIPVGLGTDSLASTQSLSLWDEMRFAYQIHRRDGVTPEVILAIATSLGAKALGMDKETGSIEPGKRADIIAVRLPQKNTGNLYSDLLRETNYCIMNMVNGKFLYSASRSYPA